MSAKADLHVHSKHSNQPSAWVLRQAGAPECYTEPLEIYRRCRELGMQYVTISDHDTIAGALEIAHLPGTFLSCEVTTRFPEDGCAIHLLVLGVSEAQYLEIDRLRGNLYELAAYLDEEDVVSSVAHPLFRVNDQLTASHWERLLLLFKRFETVNGARDPRAGDLCRLLLNSLTPRFLAELADRHGITPRDPEPWQKRFTGGSDDHSGLYLAAAYTETPPAGSVAEFLDRLKRGQHRARGEAGSSLKLARAFAAIAHRFLAERSKQSGGLPDLTHDLLTRLLAQPADAKLLRLPVTGIYHTDFPAYARALTANPFFEQVARWLMRCFYGTCNRVCAPSRATLEQLVRAGCDRSRLSVMPRGVDHRLFHPGRRVVGFWEHRGLTGRCRFVYVGRVSREKSVDTLLEAFEAFLERGHEVDLIVVGDGPHRSELEARHSGPRVHFTGFLEGEELAAAYASSDVFVFPSTTDTFGNVVLEAHACGLAAIVADRGGPPEIVRRGPSGLVYDPNQPSELVSAMEVLARDPERRTVLARRGVEQARDASWETLLAELWSNPPAAPEPADELEELELEWAEELARASA